MKPANCSTPSGRCQLVQHPDRTDELFCSTCKKRFHVTEDDLPDWNAPRPFKPNDQQEETPSFGPFLFAVLMALVIFLGLDGGNLRQQPELLPAAPGQAESAPLTPVG
jgi:hypothetical protein